MNAPIFPARMARKFTTVDVFKMVESGVLAPDERVELIEGELALMSPKHNKHEWLKNRLVRWLNRKVPDSLIVAVESTLYLTDDTFVEPDIMIYPDHILPEDVRGPDVKPLIEIADSSLAFDLGRKAALYAQHGVSPYWVIDAETKTTHVHDAGGVRVIAADAALEGFAAGLVLAALT
ncbi:MAG: Uma2 family endonuclease [Hyphomonadaceae bacterium]|nr:Uma2 family endonuclease [Hyphomonadaceae bacterium]